MRGFGKDFHTLQANVPVNVIFVSEPKKYTTHKLFHEGVYTKFNCHMNSHCPFCEKGDKFQLGLYVVSMVQGRGLCYLDITAGLFKAMMDAARNFCRDRNRKFDGMQTFLYDKMVTITKVFVDGEFNRYDVGYTEIAPTQLAALYQKLSTNQNPELKKEFERLEAGLSELIRPGSLEEDKEFINGQ